jgi:hypothetical protein
MTVRAPPRRRRALARACLVLARACLVLAILVLCDQLAQWTVLSDGVLFGRRIAPFDPPLFTDAQRERLVELREAVAGESEALARSIFDPELGWAPRPEQSQGETSFDWSGSRMGFEELPRERTIGVRRVVAVGCSYTLGAEVADREAWPALVDHARADLEIANLAMGGYGLDQALMRFVRDGRQLHPDVVWLGILPSAALRVTTCFPPILSHWNQVLAFKPRFFLDEKGELQLVRSAASTRAETLHLLEDQRALVDAIGATDTWVRRAPLAYAPMHGSWTHYFAATRLALTWQESLGREPAIWLSDKKSEIYALLRAIVLRLDKEARDTGADLAILFLPSREDLTQVDAQGHAYWDAFRDDLASIGFRCLDLAPALLAAGAREDDRYWMPRSHYSALANQLVAETIEREWNE